MSSTNWGYAHAIGHEPVLIAATAADLPFDVRHQRAQLYDGEDIETLADRVEAALRETVANVRDSTIAVSESVDATQEELLPGALDLVRADDWVGYHEGFKALVARIGDEFATIIDENWDTRPSDDSLEQLKPLRFDAAQSLVAWLTPAIEYKPEWLTEALRLLAPWYQRRARSDGGYDFWIHANETWVLLALRATLALGLLLRKDEAVTAVFSVALTTDNETSPLLLHYDATFAPGYFGDADIAFHDFDAFVGDSPTLGEVSGRLGLDQLQVSCGEDLVNGMARSVLENARGDSPPSARAPLVYAAFARYYCERIKWAAQLLSGNEAMAQAVGASSTQELNEIATDWYPMLIARRKGRLGTCTTWEQAIS